MGLGIACTLRQRGYRNVPTPVPAWRRPCCRGLAWPAPTPAEVANGVRVVVSVVVNAAQTEQVLFGSDGAAAAMAPGACS